MNPYAMLRRSPPHGALGQPSCVNCLLNNQVLKEKVGWGVQSTSLGVYSTVARRDAEEAKKIAFCYHQSICCTYVSKKRRLVSASLVASYLPGSNSAEAPTYSAGGVFIYHLLSRKRVTLDQTCADWHAPP